MPNWTSNVLDVTFRGSEKGKAQLEAFHKKVYSLKMDKHDKRMVPVFDFNGTVPMPKELEGTSSPAHTPEEIKRSAELVKKYGSGDWYDWQHKSWGVKWGACDAQPPEIFSKRIRYQFETPWTVPMPWFMATAKQFPLLTFSDQARFEGGEGALLVKVYTKDGDVEIEEHEFDEHKWKLKFDSGYKEEYDFILHGEYAKVLKKYSKNNELDNYSLAPILIRRLKKQDLPLFLEFGWDGFEDQFTSKLKGEKHVESISK